MSDPRRSSKRKRREAVPVLGAAGLSLSLASGASATPAADVPEWNTAGRNKIILADEEISDVSLATFHVFDSETDFPLRQGIKVAAGHGGCGGCGGHGGCGGGGGCAHGGGCGCARCWRVRMRSCGRMRMRCPRGRLRWSRLRLRWTRLPLRGSLQRLHRRLRVQRHMDRRYLFRVCRLRRNLLSMGSVPGAVDLCLLLKSAQSQPSSSCRSVRGSLKLKQPE